MARQARSESETSLYHVMMRGNNREHIFKNESQKRRFMEYLSAEAASGALQVGGWCLMDNHVHLVLKGQISELAQAVKRINIKFAMGFNTIEGRSGHVFQDRFRSEAVESDTHLMAVVRYVHNNPVKAKRVADPGEYMWSSYSEYLQGPAILNLGLRELVMGYFNEDAAGFAAFHQQPDYGEYLEIKEEVEQYRMERAQEVIAAYCRASGVQDAAEFRHHQEALNELIGELLDNSRLSHRKIAELVGASSSRVHQVSLRNK